MTEEVGEGEGEREELPSLDHIPSQRGGRDKNRDNLYPAQLNAGKPVRWGELTQSDIQENPDGPGKTIAKIIKPSLIKSPTFFVNSCYKL